MFDSYWIPTHQERTGFHLEVTRVCLYIIFQPQMFLWTRYNKFYVNRIRRSCRDLMLIIKNNTHCPLGAAMNITVSIIVAKHWFKLLKEGINNTLFSIVSNQEWKISFYNALIFFCIYPEKRDTLISTFWFHHNKKRVDSDWFSVGVFVTLAFVSRDWVISGSPVTGIHFTFS